MDAYAPSTPGTAWLCLVLVLGVLLLGFLLQRARPGRAVRALAWASAAGAVAVAHAVLRGEGAGLRMVVLVVVLLHSMKAVVAHEARLEGMRRMRLCEWLAFAAVWTGMQPREFTGGRARGTRPRPGRAVAFLGAGALVFALARALFAAGLELAAGLLVMAAFVSAMHFGLVPVLAALLRRLGFGAGPQFHAPWRARSLREFWARRWNVGYSVMTALAIRRPLARVLGPRRAELLAFAASGLLHEVAISLPVGRGYGLPTLYFVLHGLAMRFERGPARRGREPGRVWVWAWVLLPAPVLFHAPFLRGVCVPLLEG